MPAGASEDFLFCALEIDSLLLLLLPIAVVIISFLLFFFSLVILNLIPVPPISLCTLYIRSVLTDTHSAALSGPTVSHHPDLVSHKNMDQTTTTLTELAKCTPPNYTLCSFPRNSSIDLGKSRLTSDRVP